MEAINAVGHCLCGAVNINAKVSNQLCVCHCNMCQHWSGGPAMFLDSLEAPTLQGEEHISIYSSSAWAERAFCNCCGSHLFYKMKGDKPFYYLMAGLFDNISHVQFNMQIYVDKKPCYYAFANETKNMTEAETMAFFAIK